MNDTVIQCPSCGHAIPLTEALTAQLRSSLEAGLQAEHESRLSRAVADAEARALAGLGRTAEARAVLQEILRQAPGYPPAVEALGALRR